MSDRPLSLFEGFGIELEYMIVSKETHQVLPVADKLIHAETDAYDDVVRGSMGWSNELVNHVIEMKTQGPAPSLEPLPDQFQAEVAHINGRLDALGGTLMPTAMHPWMNPERETQLWQHDFNAVYEQFNQIFNCRGHGWSNLQSTHLNLPFANDQEFGALHAAIRLILPILPALAASSPIVEGKQTGLSDNRLQYYRNNAMRVPSVSGLIIPEGAYTRKDYEMNILARIYQDLSPFDPQGILQHEWVNARGAIARFDRSAIEIRLLDVQECPKADVAICAAIVNVLKALMGQRWVPLAEQKTWPTKSLADLLRRTIVEGQNTVIDDEKYLAAMGLPKAGQLTAGELWTHLVETTWPKGAQAAAPLRAAVDTITSKGNLAHRIGRALGPATPGGKGAQAAREKQQVVYRELVACLAEGRQFMA
jgi:carboxylate-amine ligase